jgi:hypothetical protein
MKKAELQATIDMLTEENESLHDQLSAGQTIIALQKDRIAKLEKDAVTNDWR